MPTLNNVVPSLLGKVGSAVRLIQIDFFVNNKFEIPVEIRWGKKKDSNRPAPTERISGTRLAHHVENTSISRLLSHLEEHGYELANAYPLGQLPGNRTLRFVFKHKDHMDMTPEFAKNRSEARGFFGMMCESCWRIKEAYRNPFIDNGVVTREYAFQFNLDQQSRGVTEPENILTIRDGELRLA